MSFTATGLSVITVIAIVTVGVAASVIWLLLTDPVAVTQAIGEGSVTPAIRSMADALVDAFRTLLKYL